LAVPTGEQRAFLGKLIDIWGRVTKRLAAARIGTEIAPSHVIRHQHDDVGSLLLREAGNTPATVAASAIGIAAASRCFDEAFIDGLLPFA
jgi:hypothetical protein